MASWVDKVIEAVQDYNLFEPEEINISIENNPYGEGSRVKLFIGDHSVYLTDPYDTYRWCDILTRAHNEDRKNKGETIGKEMLF